MIRDCDTCNRPCDYPGAEWYPPHVIRFCRPQMRWLIEWVDLLAEGKYPPISSEQAGRPPGRNERAPFATPAELGAEVELRLRRTGKDGRLLKAQLKAGYANLDGEAWDALNYVSGWRRKLMGYHEWARQRRFLVKRRKTTTKP